jgi:PIN domain nuclease of toxin-antitoxin system
MNRVLDACALIAFLRGENGGGVVAHILSNPAETCFSHAVNLCEVYDDFVRASDERTARSAIDDLHLAGLRPRRDLNKALWQRVGNLKGTIRRISLADCFAIALSEKLSADVVTSDHHEFDPLVATGICRVTFIR